MPTAIIRIGAVLSLVLLAPLAHAHGVGVHPHAETDGLGSLLDFTITAAIVLMLGAAWWRRSTGPRADTVTATQPPRLRG